MKININWKSVLFVVVDIIIAAYLVMAITSWNKPSEIPLVCTKVDINIEDENENGFLKTAEVKSLLEKKHLYPLSMVATDINTRKIENELCKTAFVKTAQCYISENGHVTITLTQRTPIIRVKAANGDDFYIDDNGGVMPNSQYTSDMIIATGNISRSYACSYLSIVARCIMADDLWRNQIEQINVLSDQTLEIVPRVGDHIINLGLLPTSKNVEDRKEKVTEFISNQLRRLELFYKYGLSEAGWNKYSYISLEFSNQVICTRPDKYAKIDAVVAPKKEEEQHIEGQDDSPAQANVESTETKKKADEAAKPVETKRKVETQKPNEVKKKTEVSKPTTVKPVATQKKSEKKK